LKPMRINNKAGSGSVTKSWMRAIEMTADIMREPTRVLPVVIEDLAQVQPDAPALLSHHGHLSYRELAERQRQYARWIRGQGLEHGETVCLMMPNCPEFLALWLGFTSTGVVVSLLNTNLVGASLAHCVNIVKPRLLICDASLFANVDSARSFLDGDVTIWLRGEDPSDVPNIDRELAQYPEHLTVQDSAHLTAQDESQPVTLRDQAMYIYTSGTSGLPKAARISHARIMQWSYWFAGMMDIQPLDRIYNCLPMYHSIGGIVATAPTLVRGGSVVVREKFSVAEFWNDIVKFDCTMFQYIGELCRYLVNSPAQPCETQHRLRLCCGNGLRPDVWQAFKDRFNIPQILEFYAATEGNVSLFNVEGKPGAIGRPPRFLAHRFSTKLVRIDMETGEVLRGDDGLCICCGAKEIGEAIGRIDNRSPNVANHFEGYDNPAESEKKVLRDAIEPGDCWFRTGDLMKQDDEGYFYFIDRIGDTFRWKGENVATTEVSEIIASVPSVREAVVYGVTVPGHEGRVGMAAVVVDKDFDLRLFRSALAERLPRYARPRFLRLCRSLDATATFKRVKAGLMRDSYDPTASLDPVYFDDPTTNEFVLLERDLFNRILGGVFKL
jgi:fatty-acyl-CoA synthase